MTPIEALKQLVEAKENAGPCHPTMPRIGGGVGRFIGIAGTTDFAAILAEMERLKREAVTYEENSDGSIREVPIRETLAVLAKECDEADGEIVRLEDEVKRLRRKEHHETKKRKDKL